MKIVANIGIGIAAGLVAASCGTTYRSLNANHCANQDGNDSCRDRYDGARPYCSRGIAGCEAAIELNSSNLDGCIAERPVDDACYSPCGGRLDFTEDASCLDGSSSSGESESSGGTITESSGESSGESSTTGPLPCVVNEDCTENGTPFCEPASGECVACDGTADPDGACAGLDPMLPLCVGGGCVACTPENPLVCDQQQLLCDGDTNACVPCTEHGQCGSGACELAVGACFPPDVVVHVDGDGGQAFMTVSAAVASVGAGLHGVIVVHENDGEVPYLAAGGLLVDGGKTIALLAAPGEAPILVGTGAGNPSVRVEGAGTTVYMDGLRVTDADGVGLRVSGAFAWVDRSSIVQNSGGGLLAENGAELTLRNCFVVLNGGQFVDTRGITTTGSLLDVVYTTIAANEGTGASGPISMSCDAGSTGEVRNSIVAAGDDTIACENVSFSFNVVDTAGLAGSDNDVLSFNIAWFPNIAMSDFHIAAGPPFADVAVWQAGDPTTDIDGDPRTAVNGTPDYVGADLP